MNLILKPIEGGLDSSAFKNIKLVQVVSNNERDNLTSSELYKRGDYILVPECYLKMIHIDGFDFYLITKNRIEEFQAELFKCVTLN